MGTKTHVQWAQAFSELLRKHLKERLVSVVLYGSAAKGTERPDSDLDLLIVAEGITEGRYRRRRLLDPIHEEWSRRCGQAAVPFISTVLKSPEEARQLSPLYFDMIEYHQRLFDRDNFIKGILEGVKIRLNRLGAQRRQLGKVQYWDLKPDYKPGDVFEI